MTLTLEQIHIVRDTVPILKEHGCAITTHFYADMLSVHKDLNNIFNHTNQINGQQPQALADSLFAYASHIDDLGVLGPAIERISQKHASLYVCYLFLLPYSSDCIPSAGMVSFLGALSVYAAECNPILPAGKI